MNSAQLFVQLVHRLRHYADAMFLFGMLKEQADVREFESTRAKISRRQMESAVSPMAVRRSIERLRDCGLIAVRIHANTKTHISVDRNAVLELLKSPKSPSLPGDTDDRFPFLDAWEADIAAGLQAANSGAKPETSPAPSTAAQTPQAAS